MLTSWHLFYVETYKREPQKRKIHCNLTKLNFDLRRRIIMSNLRDDFEIGWTFVFFLLHIFLHFDWFALDQSDRRSQSVADVHWPVGEWLLSTCIKTLRLLNEIGRRSFSACLQKGAVTIDYREKIVGLGPSQDLYFLLGAPPPVSLCACRKRRPKLMGFRLLNYGAVDLTVVAVYAYGLKVIFGLSVRILVRDRGVWSLEDRK